MKNEYAVIGSSVEIIVDSQRYGVWKVIIDLDDLEYVSSFSKIYIINPDKNEERFYAVVVKCADGKMKTMYLHRLITKAADDKVVDHINHNTLDNRKVNLRVVDQSGNGQNKKGANKNNLTTKIRGVSFDKNRGKYIAYIDLDYKRYNLGRHDRLEDAEGIVKIARSMLMPCSSEDIDVVAVKDYDYPKLYFIYGCMGSGKTDHLIKTANVYRFVGKKTLLLTPSIDDRHGNGVIQSRNGLSLNAVVIDTGTDIYSLVASGDSVDCVLIDEVQFISEKQVGQLAMIVDDLGVSCAGYGLRQDFMGKLFTGSEAMLSLADEILHIGSKCSFCNDSATMTLKLKDGTPVYCGDQIEIGGENIYTAVCRKHYYNPPPGGKK